VNPRPERSQTPVLIVLLLAIVFGGYPWVAPQAAASSPTVIVKSVPGPTVTVYATVVIQATRTRASAQKVPQKASSSSLGAFSPPPRSSTSPPVSNGLLWDTVAACESGGFWKDNTGNGFYGGLQFDYGTWLSNGGGKYAARADWATKAQQIAIANIVRSHRGLTPWPVCGRRAAAILGIDFYAHR
jgi:hypothetical protein